MSLTSQNNVIFKVIPGKCISCTNCLRACPNECISRSKPRIINQSVCRHCGSCYKSCPVHAIEMIEN